MTIAKKRRGPQMTNQDSSFSRTNELINANPSVSAVKMIDRIIKIFGFIKISPPIK